MFTKKGRNWWRVGVFAGLAALGMEGAAVPVVSNVKMRQLEGTKTVEITYDLADKDNPFLDVSVSVTTNGVALPVKTVSGDVYDVAPGRGKRILWEAGKDWGGQFTEIAKARVRASGCAYMVIDLSGGPAAASYPVSYLGAEPQGGWTDEHKTDKLVLRLIQPGTFTMGSPAGEVGRSSYEEQHTVTLTKPFYMGVFEVTQRQWELVMGSNPSYYKGNVRPVEYVSYDMIRGSSLGAKWPASGEVDATSFIGKVRAKTGLDEFDLPTEAQWEYACRAGTTTALNSGKNLTNREEDANMAEMGRYGYNKTDGKGGYSQHTTVGSYRPNDWGLYDMHGNVWEWCLDWWTSNLAAATDPVGASSGSGRVIRGGSWSSNAYYCRSACRYGENPSDYGDALGFRLSRTLP